MSELKRAPVPGSVLAEGEATGHAHTVDVGVWQEEDGTRTFAGPTTVEHQEHKPISLPAQKWVSGRVQEYDHFEQEAREVRD